MKNFIILSALIFTVIVAACGAEEATTCEADLFRGNPPPDQCLAPDDGSGYSHYTCNVTPQDPDHDCATTEDEHRRCRVWPNGQDPAYDNRISPFNGDIAGDGIDSDCGGTDAKDPAFDNGGSSGSSGTSGTSGASGSSGTTSGGSSGTSGTSGSSGLPPGPGQPSCGNRPNLIRNPNLDEGLNYWTFEGPNTVLRTEYVDGSMRAYGQQQMTQVNPNFWDGIIRTSAGSVDQNIRYIFEFDVKSACSFTMLSEIRRNFGTFQHLGLRENVELGTSWSHKAYEFVANGSFTDPQVTFQIGMSTCGVWVDNVKLCRL